MNLIELLVKLEEALASPLDLLDDERDVAQWLHDEGIDPETPIPVWNAEAQAWEV